MMTVLLLSFTLIIFLILTLIIMFFLAKDIDKTLEKQRKNEEKINELSDNILNLESKFDSLKVEIGDNLEYKEVYKNILKSEGKIK